MPVVYYGTESGSYSYVKTVLPTLLGHVNLTPLHSNDRVAGCHHYIQCQ